MQEKVNNCTANEEDVVKVIQQSCAQEFEEIIKNNKCDIIWPFYYQGQIFQKFKEEERFGSDMLFKFNVSKSTIMFKIALSKLINDYPKIRLHYFKKHLKIIKEVCKENASELK